jgi:ankyrin repeat protein
MAARNLEKVKALIDKGADVNGIDHRGQPVLAKAIATGDIHIVRCLVQHGANVDARDIGTYLRRPVVLDAVGGENLEVLRYLVAQGADITAIDRGGRNAVIEAVACRKLDTLKYLVEDRGMDINRPDKQGHVPITFLYEQLDEPGAYEVLQYAIDKGADVNARDADGAILLARARQCHNDKVPALLKAKDVH